MSNKNFILEAMGIPVWISRPAHGQKLINFIENVKLALGVDAYFDGENLIYQNKKLCHLESLKICLDSPVEKKKLWEILLNQIQ